MIPANLTLPQMLRLVARHYRAGSPMTEDDTEHVLSLLDLVSGLRDADARTAYGAVMMATLADTCTVPARHHVAASLEPIARELERLGYGI